MNRLAFASKHPAYTMKSIVRDIFAADERFLATVTCSTVGEILSYLGEPIRDPRFCDLLRRSERELLGTESMGADLYGKRVLVQYATIRATKPDRVLETGIANGVSSTYILYAMERNQRGHLYSIDLGDGSHLPPHRQTGWIVPDWLRERWTPHLGDARELVPSLLTGLGQLDIFIHDSLHTYDHMKFEYEQAYPHLRPGGVLISDDVLWNSAFQEFAARVAAPQVGVLRGVGILKKRAA